MQPVKHLLPPLSAPECYQVELIVPGSGKSAEENQRQGREGHQSHLHSKWALYMFYYLYVTIVKHNVLNLCRIADTFPHPFLGTKYCFTLYPTFIIGPLLIQQVFVETNNMVVYCSKTIVVFIRGLIQLNSDSSHSMTLPRAQCMTMTE